MDVRWTDDPTMNGPEWSWWVGQSIGGVSATQGVWYSSYIVLIGMMEEGILRMECGGVLPSRFRTCSIELSFNTSAI